LEAKDDFARLRAGKQIFDWSVTDTVSPSDNISPRDLSDPLEWERLGAPAVDLRLGRDSFVEVVYLPLFTSSRLPTGRWAPVLPPNVTLGEAETDRSDWQAAARMGTVLEGCDIGLSAYKGKSYSPGFEVRQEGSQVKAIPVFQDEAVYSLSGAKEIAGYTMRVEIGYFDQDGADDFVQYVVGLDREWGQVFNPRDAFYILVQYANEILVQSDEANPGGNLDFRRIFDNALLYTVRYSFSEHVMVKVRGSRGFSKGDSFLEPSLGWQQGAWELNAGLDLLSGPPETFFGGYSHNDRGFLRLIRRF
jgi:hypothetical protein